MNLHRCLGDIQVASDMFVGLAFRNVVQDDLLSLRKSLEARDSRTLLLDLDRFALGCHRRRVTQQTEVVGLRRHVEQHPAIQAQKLGQSPRQHRLTQQDDLQRFQQPLSGNLPFQQIAVCARFQGFTDGL